MKYLSLFFLFAVMGYINTSAQNITEAQSIQLDFNITKDPPVLLLVEGSLKFTEPGGNKAIDANERAVISFDVKNVGKGDASELIANVKQTGNVQGLVFDKSAGKGALAPGQKKSIEIPIQGSMGLSNGTAIFSIKLDEEQGFGLDELQLEVKTLAFVAPMIKVPDYTITSDMGSTLSKKKPFDLQILVQNVGKGQAENVNVTLSIPENVLCLSDNLINSIGRMVSGETKTFVYSLIVNEKYASNEIPIDVRLNEKYGKYLEGTTIRLQLNQSMATAKLTVESNAVADNSEVKVASLSSDVDRNIPVTGFQRPSAYALIIGNEDYSSYQLGLSKEVNVDFALNDAQIFKEYCIKTLGIPEKQIKLLPNATAGQMNQGIAWLSNLAKVDNGKAELFFYYSGHGLPAEGTNEPYLIPVDVSGSNVRQGVALADVYSRLTENASQRVTVFLDACFSGGARNRELVTQKGVKVKPRDTEPDGNMVVITSSSGEESSGVYREKKHGYLTYYLLKKLQESRAEISYGQLADYVIQSVKKETALTGKIQTPQVKASTHVQSAWPQWKFR